MENVGHWKLGKILYTERRHIGTKKSCNLLENLSKTGLILALLYKSRLLSIPWNGHNTLKYQGKRLDILFFWPAADLYHLEIAINHEDKKV